MRAGTTLASAAGLTAGLALGLVSGIATVVLHQSWWLVLGLSAAAVSVLWLRPGAARLGFATAWGVAVLRGTLDRPEGDYLVPANAAGWTLLAGSLMLLLVAIATLRRPSGAVVDHEDLGPPT